MRPRVQLASTVVDWAVLRSGRDPDDVRARFPDLDDWLNGVKQPTVRQAEDFAAFVYVPVGYLYLNAPPDEQMPIPDMRTRRDERIRVASANLLDVIYDCQRRQDWYRANVVASGGSRVAWVGSLSLIDDPVHAAGQLRRSLRFDMQDRGGISTRDAAVGALAARLEESGVLVMISGIVGSNPYRLLDPDEFGGFSMADPFAPLIFVNGVDSKGAQLFTLAHEVAHLSHGGSGVSDARADDDPNHAPERWCNQVAAEFLVPIADLRLVYDRGLDLLGEAGRLSRRYHTSTLVVLRRIFDAGFVEWARFRAAYVAEEARLRNLPSGSGGNFYHSLPVRSSKRFTLALLADTLEGGTTYKEAGRLLGLKSMATLDELGRRLGVA
jgi:Zn-dependent peptidase ImmA (M78 family)